MELPDNLSRRMISIEQLAGTIFAVIAEEWLRLRIQEHKRRLSYFGGSYSKAKPKPFVP